ncbi:MAG: hypothetical protein VB021_07065 [Oscillospiraceae bacterium]|nr:hypothetical protein [Oscillospiraceae bacterium]
MKRIVILVLSFCILLSGCSMLPSSSGTPASGTPTGAQKGSYVALQCDGQDFSVLYNSDFDGEASQKGVTIYTGDREALDKVDISVIFSGDTMGFDVSEYFYYRAEDMGNKDGNKYTLYEEMTQSKAGNATMSGAVYSFENEDGKVFRYEMLVDTGTQLIGYSCYFYEGEADEPIMAMTDAIKSYQPSADYYDSHPLVVGGGDNATSKPNDNSSQTAPTTLGSYSVTKNTPLQLQTTLYDGGFFSLQLPTGWVIETTGEYALFGFRAYDPNNPERQIFFYMKHEPLLKSMDAKKIYQASADMVGANDPYGYQISADAPVLAEPTTDYFFFIYNSYNAYVNKYGLNHQLPCLDDINILEKYPNSTPTAFNTLDNSIVRASFYSASGIECEGLMAAQVTDKISITNVYPGVDMGFYTVYNCNGVIAPAGEFNELREQLTACLASFDFTEEYILQARKQIIDETETIISMASSMQAAYDSYNAAWSARQTSYDIISQKNSDATLGYDRLYDPDTGEIYRADLGFYDDYNINRDQYSNPNLQIIDSSTENYYLNSVDYYITK